MVIDEVNNNTNDEVNNNLIQYD